MNPNFSLALLNSKNRNKNCTIPFILCVGAGGEFIEPWQTTLKFTDKSNLYSS